jgi:hypothetical protein
MPLTFIKAARALAANMPSNRRCTMPTQSEIEAAARVLCRTAYYQLPANERICSADVWPDVDVMAHEHGLRPTPYKRWETFVHEARLALEAAEYVRPKTAGDAEPQRAAPSRRAG